MKARILEKAIDALGIEPGRDYRVLDLGCGSGALLGMLASRVGEGSQLIGCDAMEQAVARARREQPAARFIRHRFVDELPFADATFDLVVTIDTVECIADQAALVAAIHRVLKPGGRLLAMHWDWDTQTYAIATKRLARKAVQAFSDWRQPWMEAADGQMGRRLWGVFEGSGRFRGVADGCCLVETDYGPGRYGYERARDLSALVEQGGFDGGDYRRFLDELAESTAAGEYFYSVTSFLYLGTRVD